VHKDAKIKNVADRLRKGYSHLAIVCSDTKGAQELLKKCEDLQKEVNDLSENKETKNVSEQELK